MKENNYSTIHLDISRLSKELVSILSYAFEMQQGEKETEELSNIITTLFKELGFLIAELVKLEMSRVNGQKDVAREHMLTIAITKNLRVEALTFLNKED